MEDYVCLLTESFAPQIDGVSNVVQNYAKIINEKYGKSLVVSPKFPHANDSFFGYPVVRYPSIDTRKAVGYMAGLPFSRKVAVALEENRPAILHSHSPAASTFLSRELRKAFDVPVVMTYHSRYDIDILKAVPLKSAQRSMLKAMVENISSCDEVWTVSKGAGESLEKIGFKGDYTVMENGVDLPLGKISPEVVLSLTGKYSIPKGLPVFLFVGRLVWYKGIKTILDALGGLLCNGFDFRMVFVGTGKDEKEIKDYAELKGLGKVCIFTGSVSDRNFLRVWYSRADLMLFPSTYDTNGLVVREAASCSLASVVLRGSCVAEGITDDRNGFLISDNPADLAMRIFKLCQHMEYVHSVGQNAADEIYISWDNAVKKAYCRYETVIKNYRDGKYPQHKRLSDEIFNFNGELMALLAR